MILYKEVHCIDLIQNEMYYVKHKEYIVGHFTFIAHIVKQSRHFSDRQHNIYCSFPEKPTYRCYLSNKYNYFKLVTKEEYYSKVKEKYDQTCLDTILKQLVNEHFSW